MSSNINVQAATELWPRGPDYALALRVPMRLDEKKLDSKNKNVRRTDNDFAVTWVKNYGKGRVFYSTLPHREEVYDMPEIKKMYIEGVKWALGLTEGDTTLHPKPASD